MSQPGLGVWIDSLRGRGDTGESVRAALGRTIKSAKVDSDRLIVAFDDGATLRLWDNGQSCCESRYMVCDDDLASFAGAKLVRIETRDAPSIEGGEVHDVEFLVLVTDKGDLVVSNHNEHNGYYGGFSVNASLDVPEATS